LTSPLKIWARNPTQGVPSTESRQLKRAVGATRAASGAQSGEPSGSRFTGVAGFQKMSLRMAKTKGSSPRSSTTGTTASSPGRTWTLPMTMLGPCVGGTVGDGERGVTGVAVGVVVCVAVPVRVLVGVRVTVAVRVAVALGRTVAVRVEVRVTVAVRVWVRVRVEVAVEVAEGGRVKVGVRVAVGVAVPVLVAVGEAVGVEDGVALGEGVVVSVGVVSVVDVSVGVVSGVVVWVGVLSRVAVSIGVGLIVASPPGVWVSVGFEVGVALVSGVGVSWPIDGPPNIASRQKASAQTRIDRTWLNMSGANSA
jgi:hypothetical protein